MLSHFSHGRLFATPWTVAHQAPLSTEFSRQEYWSGLPFHSPGVKPGSPVLQADSLPSEPPRKPNRYLRKFKNKKRRVDPFVRQVFDLGSKWKLFSWASRTSTGHKLSTLGKLPVLLYTGSESKRSFLKCQFCKFLAVWTWVSYLISLNLFSHCKIKTHIPWIILCSLCQN